ncbi:MAG TPA: DUF2190 family protein [Bacillota bacterium]|nr:DUF2190 family protein [Bacillota bacterium]
MANLDYFGYAIVRPPGGKVNDGKSVRVTVPAGVTVTAGELVYLDGWYGIAQSTVAADAGGAGEPMALSIEDCVISTSKLDSLVPFNAWDSCYWDKDANVVTTTETYGDPFIGTCVRGLANGTVHIKLAPQPGYKVVPEPAVPEDAIADAADCAGEDVAGLITSLNAGFKVKINAILAALRAAGVIDAE